MIREKSKRFTVRLVEVHILGIVNWQRTEKLEVEWSKCMIAKGLCFCRLHGGLTLECTTRPKAVANNSAAYVHTWCLERMDALSVWPGFQLARLASLAAMIGSSSRSCVVATPRARDAPRPRAVPNRAWLISPSPLPIGHWDDRSIFGRVWWLMDTACLAELYEGGERGCTLAIVVNWKCPAKVIGIAELS